MLDLVRFRPVKVEDVTKHKMHSEFYSLSKSVADTLNKTRENGKRIIAVGTTSTRTLETVYGKFGEFRKTLALQISLFIQVKRLRV